MIIEFDNSMFIRVTILIDQEKKNDLIDHYYLSLLLLKSMSNLRIHNKKRDKKI
jgi:hypothetical protein